MPAKIVTLIDALDRADQFVVYAARIHRALAEQTAPPGLCLCRGFRAMGLEGALPAFVQFQNALSTDPARSFLAGERASRTVETSELELLAALADWQQRPDEDPQSALSFIGTPSVRRIAAPYGRLFAVEMVAVGLCVGEYAQAARSQTAKRLVHANV